MRRPTRPPGNTPPQPATDIGTTETRNQQQTDAPDEHREQANEEQKSGNNNRTNATQEDDSDVENREAERRIGNYQIERTRVMWWGRGGAQVMRLRGAAASLHCATFRARQLLLIGLAEAQFVVHIRLHASANLQPDAERRMITPI